MELALIGKDTHADIVQNLFFSAFLVLETLVHRLNGAVSRAPLCKKATYLDDTSSVELDSLSPSVHIKLLTNQPSQQDTLGLL